MNWEGKAIIKRKDEVTAVTQDMVEKIKNEEVKADIERQLAFDRAENHKRRRAAKESGAQFTSIEEERRLQEKYTRKGCCSRNLESTCCP